MSFKTGDWVVDKIFEQKGRVQYIENIDGIDKYIIEDHKAKYTIDDLTKWRPKEGEWCWFYDVGMQTPQLHQFQCFSENEQLNYGEKFVEKGHKFEW